MAETLPVRHRRAAHAVPVREARRRAAELAVRARPRRSGSSRAAIFARGRAGDLLLRPARGLDRAVTRASATTTSRSAAPTSAASTPAPGRPTWATASRQTYHGSMRALDPHALLRARRGRLHPVHAAVVPDGRCTCSKGLFFGQQKHAATRSRQRERLLALGSLSAGLTHELNNPAAAAVRATSSLRDRVARHAAEADADRRRRLGPQPARDAHRGAGARRRAGRQGAGAEPARGVRPRGRAHRLVRRPRHRARLRPRADVRRRPGSTSAGSTSSPRRSTARCSTARCAG